MYKLSQLENYELNLGWKMKLWARLSALQDLWILWIYMVQPQDVGSFGSTWFNLKMCWNLGFLDLGFNFKILYLFSFLGVLSTMYSDMYFYCKYDTQGSYVNLMAYVTRPHDWRISVARGRKTLWEKYLREWSNVIWVDSFLITNNKM